MAKKIATRSSSRRLTKERQDQVRAQIAASVLLKRVQQHALGLLARPMTDSQLKAALALLNKILPDLKSVEMTNEDGLRHYVLLAVPQEETPESWARKYGYQGLDDKAPVVVDGQFREVEDGE